MFAVKGILSHPLNGHVNRRILNTGLALAMEFGEHWLQPIQTRLAAKFRSLSSADLDAYNSICREAMLFGHQQVVVTIPKAKDNPGMHYELFRAAKAPHAVVTPHQQRRTALSGPTLERDRAEPLQDASG